MSKIRTKPVSPAVRVERKVGVTPFDDRNHLTEDLPPSTAWATNV